MNFDKRVECDKVTAHFIGGLQTKIICDPHHHTNNNNNNRGEGSIYEYEKQFINEIINLKLFKKEILQEKRESIGDWVIPFSDIVSFVKENGFVLYPFLFLGLETILKPPQ